MKVSVQRKAVREQETVKLQQAVDNFLNQWHNRFVLDFWWRKRYNVPFGSSQHREMNFIDMYIDWREEENIKRYRYEEEAQKNDVSGFYVSQDEIDEDYENLDLSQFDKL